MRNIIEAVGEELKHYLPSPLMSEIIIQDNGTLWLRGKPFGVYKFFDGIDCPIFRFVNQAWMKQTVVRRQGRLPQPAFVVYLSDMGMPSLMFPAEGFPPSLDQHIRRLLESKDALTEKAKVQISDDGFEVWDPTYAMDWLHEINSSYVPPAMPPSEEVRRYPAAWEGRQITWSVGEDIWQAQVSKSQDGRVQGYVDVKDEHPVKFVFAEGGSFEFDLNLKQTYRGQKVEKDE